MALLLCFLWSYHCAARLMVRVFPVVILVLSFLHPRVFGMMFVFHVFFFFNIFSSHYYNFDVFLFGVVSLVGIFLNKD